MKERSIVYEKNSKSNIKRWPSADREIFMYGLFRAATGFMHINAALVLEQDEWRMYRLISDEGRCVYGIIYAMSVIGPVYVLDTFEGDPVFKISSLEDKLQNAQEHHKTWLKTGRRRH